MQKVIVGNSVYLKCADAEAPTNTTEKREMDKLQITTFIHIHHHYFRFLAYLVRPGFSVHKVALVDTLQVFVVLQVLAHLYMFSIGLEIGVSRCCCLVRLV